MESIQYWFSLVLLPALVVLLALLFAYLGGLQLLFSSSSSMDKPLTRIMLDLTFKRRILEVILDFFLIGIAYYLAFFFHYGMSMNSSRLAIFLQTLPVALIATYGSFYVLGVYRGVWRYVDLGDLIRYILSSVASMLLAATGVFLLSKSNLASLALTDTISPTIYALFAVFLFLGLAGTRSSFRILSLLSPQGISSDEARVLIYGAGDAGEMAVRWILMNQELHYRPVGFLEDDPFMHGRQIHGVEVIGGPEILDNASEQLGEIAGVILAVEEQSSATVQQVLSICNKRGYWVRRLRLDFESVEFLNG